MLSRDNVRLGCRGLIPLGRLMPPGVALEGLGRPIRTPSVLGEKRDISFACSRATTRHKNRRGGPLGVAVGRRMGTSEARTKEWALQSPSRRKAVAKRPDKKVSVRVSKHRPEFSACP